MNNPGQDPGQLLARLAHKHASLGVTPDRYEIFHTYLFAAIADVLGPAVTPEVAAAWDELDWLMAHTLIGLYREAGLDESGPSWQSWTAPAGKLGVPTSAGAIPQRGGHSARRGAADPAYSLSSAPQQAARRISVKPVRDEVGPDGEVSNWRHANVAVGDVLRLSNPYANPVVDTGDAPLLLASAGISCTPVISILQQPGRDVLHAPGDRSARRPITDQPRAAGRNCMKRCASYRTPGYTSGTSNPPRMVGRIRGVRPGAPSGPARRPGRLHLRTGAVHRVDPPTADQQRLPATGIRYEPFGPDLAA